MHIKELYSLFIKSTGVTTDSRQVQLNSIFFCIKGQKI